MALVPLAALATIALLLAKRRIEAMQLATTAITAPILVYIIKMAVGRATFRRKRTVSRLPGSARRAVASVHTVVSVRAEAQDRLDGSAVLAYLNLHRG